ncbi:MAG: type II toxin-antitoxin system VapC family toxin [Thermoguttaceae bacterium]
MNELRKPTIYLETSTISYLASRPVEEPIRRAKQILTKQWWELRDRFELFISDTVSEEIVLGDLKAAEERLTVVENIRLLPLTSIVQDLADALIDARAVPREVRLDANHIACAAVHGIDFLITWNQKHIASEKKRDQIKAIIAEFGLRPPRILTPEAHLLEETT